MIGGGHGFPCRVHGLIGISIRITVGRDAENREVEYKLRRESDSSLLKVEDAIKLAIKTVDEEK